MSIGQSLDGAENFIHTLRETSVVLDSDLAKLYKLPLRTLNSAATRHASRFPKDFRFELTPEEISSLGLTSKTPVFAYTEAGIAMLSTVLDSPLAARVSVSLIRSAVEMRHFITKNSPLLENVAALELKQIERQKAADEKLAKIINFIEEQECRPSVSQKIFFSGQIYDAYSFLAGLIGRAKASLTLVDGYVNVNTLDLLRNKKKDLPVFVLSLPSTKLSKNEIARFNSEYPTLTVYKTSDFHDRFLILDDHELYHIGASLKDAGEKSFAITRLEEKEETSRLLERIASIKSSAKTV